MTRFQALATDYDGTLAHHGRVAPATLAALDRLKASGCRLLLVTGRELEELLEVFPEIDRFDRVVAENGALLYDPAESREWILAEPPPTAFAERLRARGAERVSVGRVIVATWEPAAAIAREVIHEMGLASRVILNKRAVMILPAGVDKATGLEAALKTLRLASEAVLAVGDAENDRTFLDLCGRSAAVANALPAIKQAADIVLPTDHGDGVAALIDALLGDDLDRFADRSPLAGAPTRI